MPQDRDYLPVLEKLIGFPTVSADSNLGLIDYAQALLDEHGYSSRRYLDATGRKANLLARIGPDVPGGMALAGHTDVVPTSGQRWQTDPFRLVRQEDLLYGRGTCDMKGFIALALAAAVSVDPARLRRPLHLILTYDEEVGCLGAQALTETLRTMPAPPRFVLIGEPTGMQVVTAHKGIRNLETRVRGKPAHSSRPDLGASAIAFAARFIDGIAAALPQDEDPAFDPPTATFNIGRIRGGEAVNIIPEWCELGWEFRHLPQQDPQQIQQSLERLSRHISREMTGITEETEVKASVPGLTAGANVEIAAWLQRFMKPQVSATGTVPFVTEGGVFQEAGIPAVICGPGRLEQAHQPDEHVSLRALDEYREFLSRLVSDFLFTPG